MAYQGNLLSKTLVIGIILLFVAMSIIPSVAVDSVKIEHANGKSSGDDIDWWPMFLHDLIILGIQHQLLLIQTIFYGVIKQEPGLSLLLRL